MLSSTRAMPAPRHGPILASTVGARTRTSRALELDRVVVIGTSGTGKTTFARRLATALGAPCVELDELFWGPGWHPKPEAEFLRLSIDAAAPDRWVIDGNYKVARPLLWPRATTIVWLNYGLPTALARTFRRTLLRAFTRQSLWHGNRESLRRSFLSRESILLWVVTTHGRRKREFAALRVSDEPPLATWIEFRRPSEAEAFLTSFGTTRRASNARTGP